MGRYLKNFLIAIYLVLILSSCKSREREVNTGFVQMQPMEREAPKGHIEIVRRALWTQEAPNYFNLDPMTNPYRITIHHTAIEIGSNHQRDERLGLLRIIDIHKRKNGWADIGYHYLIGTSGTIYEGRNIKYQGAHARGDHNIGNIGVAVMGDYETGFPPRAQVDAMKKLVKHLQEQYKIQNRQIYGHVHFTGTMCPGKNMMPYLRDLQNGK